MRFSIRWTAPPTWLTSFWFAVTCAFRPSIAEAAPLHEQYPTQMNPGTPLPVLPHSPGLRSRIWYGAGSNASAIQAARDGVNRMSSTLVFEHGDKPFGDIQAEQLRAYRQAWAEAGHDWVPRVSVSRSIFPLLSERDRGLYGLSASGDQVGHLDSGIATFGRTYAANPSTLINQLSQDRALAEADTLLLTIPNQLGFEENWLFACKGVGGVGVGRGAGGGVGGVPILPPVGPSCAWRGAAVSGSVCQFRVCSCVLGQCTRTVGITPLLFGCTAT